MGETRARSVVKTIVWRLIAIANSFIILSSGLTTDAFMNAICMNITGFFCYYLYERLCARIPYGVMKEGAKE